ncbi:hypothetical protein [Rhizobium sp. PEPV16]|uniref:hypothetical protein n=1 Tax=Rhizobium sp. PEPV16 TaxID=1820614 RepID=UPI001FED62E7|nr:hypothetical protein [Rhizobium sp. PEPV16]
MLEGWGRMRKSLSFISLLLAFVVLAGEGHAAISYQRLDGAPGERGLAIKGAFEISDDPKMLVDVHLSQTPKKRDSLNPMLSLCSGSLGGALDGNRR